MKSVIFLLTLCILHLLVQEISSFSPRAIAPLRGNYGGSNYGGSSTNKYKPPNKQGYGDIDEDNISSFFPDNAMMLFQLKSSIQSALHKIEDEEEALDRIEEEIKLLNGLADILYSYFEDAVEGLMAKCVIYGASGLPNPIKIGNKCYTISDTNPGSSGNLEYADAKQFCLAHGGYLARPFLLKGSTFGSDLAEALDEMMDLGSPNGITGGGTSSNYWIDGLAESPSYLIETSGGFHIPIDFFRYLKKYFPPYLNTIITEDSGLTIVGSLFTNEVYWSIEPMDEENSLPYICEYDIVFNLGVFSTDLEYKFRNIKSSLLQKFLKKVRLNLEKKSTIRESVNDHQDNQKTEDERTDAITKEFQNVKVIGKGEIEKQTVQQTLAHGTKTDEVVIMAKITKPVEMPAVTKKVEPLEIMKTPEKEGIKVVEELPIKEDDGISKEEVPIKEGDGISKEEVPSNEGGKILKEEVPIKEGDKISKEEVPIKEGDGISKEEVPINEGDKILKEEVPIKEGEGFSKGEVPLKEGGGIPKDEVPIKEGEGIPMEEVVLEGNKNVNEKKLLLEDILGKLEQLESFRALIQ